MFKGEASVEVEDSFGSTTLGLILKRLERDLQGLGWFELIRAASTVYDLLVPYQVNASHASVKRPLELLMARKDLPKEFKEVFDEYKEYKEKQGITP